MTTRLIIVIAVAAMFAGCAPRRAVEPEKPPPAAEKPPADDAQLEKLVGDLRADLEQKRTSREKLRESHQGVVNEMEKTAKEPDLSGAEKSARLAPLLTRRAEIESDIASIDRAIGEAQQKVDILSKERANLVVDALKKMEDAIALLRLEERQIEVEQALKAIELKMSRLTAPTVQEIKERVEQHRKEVAALLAAMTEDVRAAAKEAKSYDVLNALREMEYELIKLSRLTASDDFEEVWSDVILRIKVELEKYRKP